jgi:anti-anti-sigma factor
MSLDTEYVVPGHGARRPEGPITVIRGPCSQELCVLYVEGPLHEPLNGELRRGVDSLLRRGKRNIVLDLARVSRIDAAGISELVRAYNMSSAANAVLRTVHVTARVREMLDRVGLFDILSAGAEPHSEGRLKFA